VLCRKSSKELFKECEGVIDKGHGWVHVRCQRWHPEIKLSSENLMFQTKNFGGNLKDSDVECLICRKVTPEHLARCIVDKCDSVFHPTCL
jgi:hypothetical protein